MPFLRAARRSLLACAALAVAGAAAAENWPQWRGPANDGISGETHLPTKWGATDDVAWKLSLPGMGESTPAVWGDRIFLHVADGARAIAHVLKSSPNQTARRVFNVVGENYQKRGLVELARKHFPGVEIAVTDRNPDLRDYRVDGSRITQELGFVTRFSVEDAFCETAQAVADGVFRDPDWAGHSAIPLDPAALRP